MDRLVVYERLLKEIGAELAQKRAEIRNLELQEEKLSELYAEISGNPVEEGPMEKSQAAPFSSDVRRIARLAIEKAQRPLNRSEILAAVRKAGVTLPERNPGKKVSKILWADSEFENVKGLGYRLVPKSK
jgi:hypothetical protein